MATSLVLRAEPGPEVVTYYTCVRNGRLAWVGTTPPERCPRGSEFTRTSSELVDPNHTPGHKLTVFLRRWLSIPGVMMMLTVASLLWLTTWRQLARSRTVEWLLVPLLAFSAAACVAGPGHWFPKEPWEGPSVISLGAGDAVTVLDLIGFALAAASVTLAFHVARHHRRHHA